MVRTNLSVDREVFLLAAAEANKRNMTLFSYANQALSAVSKIAAEGGEPSEVYSIWRTISILKEAEALTLPSGFVEGLIADLYASDRTRLLGRFHELGETMVGLLKIFADDVNGLSRLARDFGFIVPIKRFDLANGDNGNIHLDIVGAGRSVEATECSTEFVKAVLDGYGYSVTKEDVHPGAIRIWGQKKAHTRTEVLEASRAW